MASDRDQWDDRRKDPRSNECLAGGRDYPGPAVDSARCASSQATFLRLSARRSWLNFFDVDNIGRIFAGVAGRTVRNLLALSTRFLESFQREICERICTDVVADLVNRSVGG